MAADDFVYDTDPAARAVVIARRAGVDVALRFLHDAQRAFYAEGRDVTRPATLAAIAESLGLEPDRFAEDLASDEAKQETWRDYAISRGAGVTGFPTLIAGPQSDGTYLAVTRGFQPADVVLPHIEAWMAG
jgi:putative protein-disulfide isomerase